MTRLLNLLLLSFLTFVVLGFTTSAIAANDFDSAYEALKQRVEAAQTTGMKSQLAFDRATELNTLPEVVLNQLSEISSDQAQIWGDTILEGDYESDGRTRLDRVEVVSDAQGVIGYRITYSENAWFLGGEPNRQPGRIAESCFVDLNFKAWSRDDRAPAQFR